MDAKLVVVGGKASKGEVKLKLPTVLGRSRDAGLAIAHPNVSRRHCEIREVEGALVVRDLGSSNGTLVNDELVKEVVLKPGDKLCVGPLVFRAEYKHAGKFPSLGKDSAKAAVADTTEFVPEQTAPLPTKTVLDKTVAKASKTIVPPPPEAKKPQPPKEEPPTKKEVDGGHGKLEKASKAPAPIDDLDDLSLPDLDEAPAPSAAKNKKADLEDLPELPSMDEPPVAAWQQTEATPPADEADADLALPSFESESESLPDLSDELELPEPDSLAEEPELESAEAPPLEPAATQESWEPLSEPKAEDDLALADELPPLDEVEPVAAEADLDLLPDLSFDETPAVSEEDAGPVSEPSAGLNAEQEVEEEIEAIDDLGLAEEMSFDEVPSAPPAEEAIEPEAAWADEPAVAASEEVEADALPESSLDEPDEPLEFGKFSAEVEQAPVAQDAEDLDDLNLVEELPPIAEAATANPLEDAIEPAAAEPEAAWTEEPIVAATEEVEAGALPEPSLDEPLEFAEFSEAPVAEEVEQEPVAGDLDDLNLVEAAEEVEQEPVAQDAEDLDDLNLVEELPPIAEAATANPLEEAIEPAAAWIEEPASAEAELDRESPESELPETPLTAPEPAEEIAAVGADEVADEELDELGLMEELPPIAEAASAAPMAKTLEPDPAWFEDAAEDESGELGLAEETPMPTALEPDPAWFEEATLEEAELEAAPAAADEPPEMTLAEPEAVQEVAAAPEDQVEDEIGELGLAEEAPAPMALEPDPSWPAEPALEEAKSEEEPAEVAEVDDLPEMTLAEPEEIQEVAAIAEDAIQRGRCSSRRG